MMSTSDAVYEVTFLFDNLEMPNVPRFNVSVLNPKATLHEPYLVGQIGKWVGPITAQNLVFK